MREVLALLANFSTMFKRRRVEIGITQRRVGRAMEQYQDLRCSRTDSRGVSQTYVSCFEELRLSPVVMVKLLPLFQRFFRAMLTNEYQRLFPELEYVPPSEADVNVLQVWEARADIVLLEARENCLTSRTVSEWIAMKERLQDRQLQPQSEYFPVPPDSF